MTAPARDTLPVVVFDLDSTLADTRHRREHLPIGATCPADWTGYHVHCLGDRPVLGTIALVRLLHPNHRIVIVTARPDETAVRANTAAWLVAQDVPHDGVIFLPLDELRPPAEWKAETVEKLRADLGDVVLAVDDWGPNGWAIEATGTPFLHVARPGADAPKTPGI